MFDSGAAANTARFGSASPPGYALRGAVRFPVALYYGANDWIADPADVRWLADELGPGVVRKVRRVPLEGVRMEFRYRGRSLLLHTSAGVYTVFQSGVLGSEDGLQWLYTAVQRS